MSELPNLEAYPGATSAASGTRGSYAPVFIVLTAIAVLAMIACFLGRLCARCFCKPKKPSSSSVPDMNSCCSNAGGDIEYALDLEFSPTNNNTGRRPVLAVNGNPVRGFINAEAAGGNNNKMMMKPAPREGTLRPSPGAAGATKQQYCPRMYGGSYNNKVMNNSSYPAGPPNKS